MMLYKIIIYVLSVSLCFSLLILFAYTALHNTEVKVEYHSTWHRASIENSKSQHRPPWTWLLGPNTGSRFNVIVTSAAYYDDRRTDGRRYLRTHWIFTTNTEAAFWKNLRFVVCDRDKQVTLTDFFIHRRKSVGRIIKGSMYKQFLVSHYLDSVDFVPDSVIIYSHKFTPRNHTVKVYRMRSSGQPTVKFAVCVKPMYGELRTDQLVRLIEWIEIHKLLGISEFHFYNATLHVRDQKVKAMFELYNTLIRMHPFDVGFTSQFGTLSNRVRNNDLYSEEYRSSDISARAAFTHCLYTNYRRVQYVLIIDFDEVLLPRIHHDYVTMIDWLLRSRPAYNQASSISFDMVMFFDYYGADVTQPSYLHTLQYRKRITAKLNKEKHTTVFSKSFIKPDSCVLAFHHACVESVMADNVKSVMFVPQYIGLLHHYRYNDKFNFTAKNVVQDDVIFKFKDRLQRAVETRLKQLNITYS